MANVELLPLPEPVVVAEELEFGAIYAYESRHMEAYARANLAHAIAAKDAEIKKLRESLDWAAERIDWLHEEERVLNERAERLAEALRTIACMSEYFGKELSDARRLAEKAVADLAQEDRND